MKDYKDFKTDITPLSTHSSDPLNRFPALKRLQDCKQKLTKAHRHIYLQRRAPICASPRVNSEGFPGMLLHYSLKQPREN